MGDVWQLRTPEGRWALKAPFETCTEEEVSAGAAFQEAARAAGVPTPEIRRTSEGSVFTTVDGAQVRLYEWVDLREADPLLDPALVGQAVAGIHRVRLPPLGRVDGWYSEPVGAARWDRLVERLRTAGAPFAGRLAELRDDLVALESWIERPRILQTCHRDLWADNVLPTADRGVCVIDWENSGPEDLDHELGCVLFEFGRSDAGRARALVDAYRGAGGPGTVDRRGSFSMLIAQLGHITQLAATDWLEPNRRSPHRADAAGWIAEVLDDPHTPEVLDALLAAVSVPGQ